MISAAALTVVGAGAAFASPEAETTRRPAVAMTNEDPVVVAGRGFANRERIALSVRVGGRTYTRTVRATVVGTFRATFDQADAQCHPYSVTAVGAAGSRATQTRRFVIPPPCGIAEQP